MHHVREESLAELVGRASVVEPVRVALDDEGVALGGLWHGSRVLVCTFLHSYLFTHSSRGEAHA